MFMVRAINDSDSVVLANGVTSIDEARRIGCNAYTNRDIDEQDIVQVWSDDDDTTAADEFGSDEC